MRRLAVLLSALVLAAPLAAQMTDAYPAEEFAARRAAVMKRIGDSVAIIQGTIERPGEQHFRQANQFYYLSGIIQPRVILVIDGRTKRTTAYLDRWSMERAYGIPSLAPSDSAAKLTGVDSVKPRAAFADAMKAFAADGRAIFTPFRPEVLGEASSTDPQAQARATKSDPWDGRSSREEAFIQKLKEASPTSAVKNLDPIIDSLRSFKSPREIAVIREATRIAGLGIMEAMRDARPGMHEYELQADAEYVFKKYNSYGPSYFALIATGTNTQYTHYHENTAVLKKGDYVQMDYAPDYKYEQSDMTRIFPADGKFTPKQRELYTIYLDFYQAILGSIKVHMTQRDVVAAALIRMDTIMAHYKFTDTLIRNAATTFVASYRRGTSLGHSVGLEVHDVRLVGPTLEPGYIFTIEPQMNVLGPVKYGVRLEDMILITETGPEILSSFVPIEIADIEKLMAQPGLSDAELKLVQAVKPKLIPVVKPAAKGGGG